MASCGSKKILRIETLDRISQLPEPIIHHILSYLPLEDSARASVLSKTWKMFCSSYPVHHFDHNLFALQLLISSKEACGPSVDQIRDMFLDYVDYHLARVSPSNLPVRKLSLIVGIDDSSVYYSRVDKWLKLIKQMNVEDLCIFVQTFDFVRVYEVGDGDSLYQFPFSLLDSKSLRSVSIRGCMLGHETFSDTESSSSSGSSDSSSDCGDTGDISGGTGDVSFSSLQQLCLSHVYIAGNGVDILARCCPGIEILVLDNCTIMSKALELSKFPKLKKALIEGNFFRIQYVGIANTNLECFKCVGATECHISRDACAGIREFTLLSWKVNEGHMFKDLTATFPHAEEINVRLRYTDKLKAASNVLRKLKFHRYALNRMKEVHIDCPSLTLLDCSSDTTNLYVNCPKLRVFRYNGHPIPEQLFFRSADLDESSCSINCGICDKSCWFIKLRVFLQPIMARSTNISLVCQVPMETFKYEEVKSVQASPQSDVNLTLTLLHGALNNVAALVDPVLWIIRPTTLTFDCRSYNLLKYLCENLGKKSQDKTDGEEFCHPCWLHHMEDFQIESLLDISDIKQNLASLPELCRTIGNRGDHAATGNQICFKFRWCSSK